MPLARLLGGLDILDVSGNALGSSGAAVLLLGQQEHRVRIDSATGEEAPHRCKLVMEDVCVRPDTHLMALMLRAASGAQLDHAEMKAGGVLSAAEVLQPPAAKGATKGKGKKVGKGDKQWERDTRPEGGGGVKGGRISSQGY